MQPEAIALCGTTTDTGLLVKQIQQLGIDALLVGGTGGYNAKTVEIAGSASEGFLCVGVYVASNPDEKVQIAAARVLKVLTQAVQSISDLIRDTGFINLDFADVTAIMKDAGLAHMGVGRAAGKNKAEEAARMAISSPLLETSINGAHGVLINVTGSMDIGLDEVEQAASLVQEAVHPDALTIFGATFDETLDDEIRVTVIATGFDKAPGALDFNKEKGQAEQSGEAAAGLTPLDFDKEKAEEEAKHEAEPDPFDDIFKIFNRER